jgi:hypothetical protein
MHIEELCAVFVQGCSIILDLWFVAGCVERRLLVCAD